MDGDSEEGSRRVALRGPGCLTVLRGPEIGLTYRIADERVLIGRGADAVVVVDGEGASRRHAELIRNATGSIRLVDLDSRNGTLVNGVRVRSAVLEDGDRIRIGDTELDFRYERQDNRTTVDLALAPVAPPSAARSDSAGKPSVSGRLVATMTNLAKVHLTEGRVVDALATYQRARTTLETNQEADPPRLAEALIGIGECQLHLARPERAVDPFERALSILVDVDSSERHLAVARLGLARAVGIGDARAVDLIARAREGLDPFDRDDKAVLERIDAWERAVAGAEDETTDG